MTARDDAKAAIGIMLDDGKLIDMLNSVAKDIPTFDMLEDAICEIVWDNESIMKMLVDAQLGHEEKYGY